LKNNEYSSNKHNGTIGSYSSLVVAEKFAKKRDFGQNPKLRQSFRKVEMASYGLQLMTEVISD
jgi:hypothetical protein